MEHHGNALKRGIALSNASVGEIAKMVGISRQTIYDLYKLPTLTYEYIQLFKKAGIDIVNEGRQMSASDKPAVSKDDSERKLRNEIFHLQVEVKLLREHLNDIQKAVTLQEADIGELKYVTFKKKAGASKVQGK